MENIPKLNEKKGTDEVSKHNKASFLKTLGLAASVAIVGGEKAVAKGDSKSDFNKVEKLTSDNIKKATNDPRTIDFIMTSESIDAAKYFDNILDSISLESREEITEQFVNEVLKKINYDNFLEIVKLDWVIYAGGNGLSEHSKVHALAFKEILNKAKMDVKNFDRTLPKERIKIIMDKDIKIKIPSGEILPPTMFKKPNGEYYTIAEINKMFKKHPEELIKLQECSEVLEFGFYAPVGDKNVPGYNFRNTGSGISFKTNSKSNSCNCGSTIFNY